MSAVERTCFVVADFLGYGRTGGFLSFRIFAYIAYWLACSLAVSWYVRYKFSSFHLISCRTTLAQMGNPAPHV